MVGLRIKHAVHVVEVVPICHFNLEILLAEIVNGMPPNLPDAKSMGIAIEIMAMLQTKHAVPAMVVLYLEMIRILAMNHGG